MQFDSRPRRKGGFYRDLSRRARSDNRGANQGRVSFFAEDALVAILAVYVQEKREIPTPSPVATGQELVAVPPVAAAKLALYTAMCKQGITRDALAARLGLSESAIRKLIDPDCYSHISQIMKALKTVGRNLVVEDRAA